MTELLDLSTSEMASRIAARHLDPVDVVTGLLERIDQREPQVHAWAFIDREVALADAKAMAIEAQAGTLRGPLHGVPIGIKDVFHAKGMPTLANSRTMDPSAIYEDSGAVAALRQAGAIMLGKCETVEFAGMGIPPQTRNPWNTQHTGAAPALVRALPSAPAWCPPPSAPRLVAPICARPSTMASRASSRATAHSPERACCRFPGRSTTPG